MKHYKTMKHVNQGDVYLANLDPIKGHEQAGVRPVVILQNNILNRNLNTVIVAPLTSNLSTKGRVITCFLPKEKTGLKIDSVALFFQIRTLDKSRLIKEVGHISKNDFLQLRVKMMRVFY